MPIKPKIAPTPLNIKTTPIPNDLLKFTFKYYQHTSDKFHVKEREPIYFLSLLERLKDVCFMTSDAFKNNGSKVLRAHPIEWSKTTEEDGFNCFNNQLKDFASSHAYQFSISANENGRIHGFLLDDLFCIVWLDPDHKLYE